MHSMLTMICNATLAKFQIGAGFRVGHLVVCQHHHPAPPSNKLVEFVKEMFLSCHFTK